MAKSMPLPPEAKAAEEQPVALPGFSGVVSRLPKGPSRPELRQRPGQVPQDGLPSDPAPGADDTFYVPLSRLRPSPYNSRKVRPTARIEEVANMLRRDGQLVELHVYPGTGNEAGRYFIIGGITRYLAAPLAGLGELRVRQIQADTSNIAALIQISKQLNDSLEESDIDDAVFAKQLAEENHTQDEIAKMLGFKSRGSIHRLNAYFELPESIVELGKSNPSIFSAALAAILLTAFKDHGESFATDLLRKALLPAPDNLSHSELKHLIALESRRAARDKNAKTRKRLESKVEFKIRGITVGDLAIHKCPEGRKSVAFFAECDAGNADELAQRMKDLIREFSDRAN